MLQIKRGCVGRELALLFAPLAFKLAAELIDLPAAVAKDSFTARLHYELRSHQTGIAEILGLVMEQLLAQV